MGRVVHFELPADDPERAVNFYQKALGWTIKKWDGPVEYWLVMTGPEDEPGIDGGLAPRSELQVGAVNTIDVASVDEVTARVEEHGGKVVHPRHPVPGVGWMAYCEDTEGTVFGVMERDPDAG
jgi:hypothetical protein